MNENGKRKEWLWGGVTAAGTLLCCAGAFFLAGRFPGRNHIFLWGDYYIQYIQLIKLFWRNLLDGHLSYAFEYAMGQQTMPIYAFYALSPFNLFFLLFSDTDLAAFMTFAGKSALAAGVFYHFLRKEIRAEQAAASVFALFYGLCGYVLNFYTHICLVDSLYILPVLVILLLRFVRTGKWIALSVAYAYSFITCFYSGYQTGLFSFVMFVTFLWYFYGFHKAEKQVWIDCGIKFVICVVCAALVSAVVTVPTAWFLFRNRGNDVYAEKAFLVNIGETIASLFLGRSCDMQSFGVMLYSGLPVLILLPAFCLEKKISRRQKMLLVIPLVFLLLCTFTKGGYLLINAFDVPNGNRFRFSYMYSFLFASASAAQMSKGETGKKKMLAAGGCAAGVLLILYVAGNSLGMENLLELLELECNVVFLFLWIVVFLVVTKNKKSYKWILLPAWLECFLNLFFALTPDDVAMDRQYAYYKLWHQQAESALTAIRQDAGAEEFYRVYYENFFSPNDPSYFGYNGLGYFASMEKASYRKEMDALGYYTYGETGLYDYGSTDVMRMLFSQKYLVHATDPRIESEDNFCVQKNERALPLGYMVSEQLTAYSAADPNPFQNQNRLLAAMCGNLPDVFEEYTGEVKAEADNADLLPQDEGMLWQRQDMSKWGTAMYRFPADERKCFVYFAQEEKKALKDTARVATEKDAGFPLQLAYLNGSHIMEMAPGEDGSYEVGIIMDGEKVQTAYYYEMYSAYLNEDVLQKAAEILGQGALSVEKWNNGMVEGTVTATAERPLLFLSIPYDTFWEVSVDGQVAEYQAVMDETFMAVPLTPGQHRIVLRYRDKSLEGGAIVTLAGVLCWGGAALRNRRKKSEGR
ncbi:MAG: YfhO family protein [Lachnospiraceae bacterium]|nr:YfhO family protein [Lachnospiraceae bacterium]